MKQSTTKQTKISVIGGDLRQCFICEGLGQLGYTVTSFGLCQTPIASTMVSTNLSSVFESNTIITGIPFSKDGVHLWFENAAIPLTISDFLSFLSPSHTLLGGGFPESVTTFCTNNHITCIDFMKKNEIAIANAISTAEGAIMEAILHSTQVLHKSPCLVLGFGRCAKILAEKLKGLQARVCICARKEEALAYCDALGFDTISFSDLDHRLGSFSYIFNTIPSVILDETRLSLVDSHATIIDIASAPGGLDYPAAKRLQRNAQLCLGLPGKTAPKAAANILLKHIVSYLLQ